MPDYLPLTECEHGWLYRILARNFRFGVFKQPSAGFTGIREKFGDEYLDTEYHYDTGAPHGTASPIEKLCPCPIKDLREGWPGEEYWVQNQPLFDWLKQQEKERK